MIEGAPKFPIEEKPEDKNISSADRRRKKAEKKDGISLSHWGGDLHSHTGGYDLDKGGSKATPEDVVRTRRGSNDGYIPTEVIGKEHQKRGDRFLGSTDHARESSPQKALKGITDWFTEKYKENLDEIEALFGQEVWTKMSEEERRKVIHEKARELAEEISFYGDERLIDNLERIDVWNRENVGGLRMLRGVETSILPDGTLDTPLVDQGKFELVVVSIHPNVDNDQFESIVSNPREYEKLVVKAIKVPQANIVGHIGYGGKPKMDSLNEQLNWDLIAREAIENGVAIEINLKGLFKILHNEILDEKKYPVNDNSYKEAFKQRLPELIPILSSDVVMQKLAPYFSQGLKLAVNTDKHSSPFVEYDVDKKSEAIIRSPGHRYWVCMKILERYFNSRFERFGVRQNNVVNSYSKEDLENFLQKK